MFNWGDPLCNHGLCVVNPGVATFFGSPIGGLLGVEGTIVSKSRPLKLLGNWLSTFMLMIFCVFSTMHSPYQMLLVSQHRIQSLILCKCSLLSRIKLMFI